MLSILTTIDMISTGFMQKKILKTQMWLYRFVI